MAPIKIVHGIATVTIYEIRNKSWLQYQICWRVGKKRMRRAMADKAEAIREAGRIAEELSTSDTTTTEITKKELLYFKKCEKMLDGVPLHVAVDYYSAHASRSEHKKSRRCSLIVEEYIHHLHQSLGEKITTKLVAHRLRLLCGYFRDTVDTVTAPELLKYFATKGWSPGTQRHHLHDITALFRYAQRKGYLPEGPTEADTAAKQITPLAPPPKIYSPREMKTLLQHVRVDGLPFLALGAFAGLRPKEITVLTWRDIDFAKKQIRVGDDNLAPLLPNLAAILVPFAKSARPSDRAVPISQPHKEYTKKTIDAANLSMGKQAGEDGSLEWKENGLRNSFIVYYRALSNGSSNGHADPDSMALPTVARAIAKEYFSLSQNKKVA